MDGHRRLAGASLLANKRNRTHHALLCYGAQAARRHGAHVAMRTCVNARARLGADAYVHTGEGPAAREKECRVRALSFEDRLALPTACHPDGRANPVPASGIRM